MSSVRPNRSLIRGWNCDHRSNYGRKGSILYSVKGRIPLFSVNLLLTTNSNVLLSMPMELFPTQEYFPESLSVVSVIVRFCNT